MKKITIIDGQGGRMGKALIEHLKREFPDQELLAVGTNSIATAAMLKAGADYGATGENPVLVAARDSDIIIGPIGIVIADSLFGEVTPAMAAAVGRSHASQILMPNRFVSFFNQGTENPKMLRYLRAEPTPKRQILSLAFGGLFNLSSMPQRFFFIFTYS